MRKFLYLILVMSLGTATACTDGVIGLSNDVEGTYQIETINGRVLPYTLSGDATYREVVRSGRLRLYSDGEFVEDVTLEVTEYGITRTFAEQFSGYWEVSSRDELMLEYDDTGDRIYGDVEGRNSLVLYGDGMTIVYRR